MDVANVPTHRMRLRPLQFGRTQKQDGLDGSRGARLTQILFVLSGEFPRVMNIIGKMHDFDFVALIQGQPQLVFRE